MSNPDTLSPSGMLALRAYVRAFQCAPTRDLIAAEARRLDEGETLAELLDFLFSYEHPDSPFNGYGRHTRDEDFVATLLGCLSAGSGIDDDTLQTWHDEMLAALPHYATRGEFAASLFRLLDTAPTPDAGLAQLRAALDERTARALAYARSANGAVFSGALSQLLEPLQASARDRADSTLVRALYAQPEGPPHRGRRVAVIAPRHLGQSEFVMVDDDHGMTLFDPALPYGGALGAPPCHVELARPRGLASDATARYAG